MTAAWLSCGATRGSGAWAAFVDAPGVDRVHRARQQARTSGAAAGTAGGAQSTRARRAAGSVCGAAVCAGGRHDTHVRAAVRHARGDEAQQDDMAAVDANAAHGAWTDQRLRDYIERRGDFFKVLHTAEDPVVEERPRSYAGAPEPQVRFQVRPPNMGSMNSSLLGELNAAVQQDVERMGCVECAARLQGAAVSTSTLAATPTAADKPGGVAANETGRKTPAVLHFDETQNALVLNANTESAARSMVKALEEKALTRCVQVHITQGGDDRLHLNKQGVNKYYCPPTPLDHTHGVVLRGSCTCSPPTPLGFARAEQVLRSVWENQKSVSAAMEDLRTRIAPALGLVEGQQVTTLLHPSGSDAEMIPMLIAQIRALRSQCTRIVNVVVAAGEVGSGTANAAGGKHFSDFVPSGALDTKNNAAVLGFQLPVDVIEVKPRHADGHRIADYDARVYELVALALRENPHTYFVMHAVDGSKTGLRVPSKQVCDQLLDEFPNNVLLTLDACQGRSSTEELLHFLERDAPVLFTASKFFSAPGFCGAVLLPESCARDLANMDAASVPCGLGDYLTKLEVPSVLRGLHSGLPEGPPNAGLLVRWACGIAEMEAFAALGPDRCHTPIANWVQRTKALVAEESARWLKEPKSSNGTVSALDAIEVVDDSLDGDLAPQTRLGQCNSIVCVRIRSATEPDRWLSFEELKVVHKWLASDSSSLLEGISGSAPVASIVASTKCFVGQPVKLGKFAVLRLAMSAPLARRCAGGQHEFAKVLEEDRLAVRKMLFVAKCLEYL
ncbi:hypothetical protein FVE85_6387 [Porphyridium purpureum]|uniref:Uncharacterized protein n=1 Tax=Porphyridium purpureum TaxID=35688 RepID=A0A5J4Z6X0_PORPP|nr:hypothetical protein FVE85_6387 [Porphyridium purpureum]|eukprot:POR7132..scf295_1